MDMLDFIEDKIIWSVALNVKAVADPAEYDQTFGYVFKDDEGLTLISSFDIAMINHLKAKFVAFEESKIKVIYKPLRIYTETATKELIREFNMTGKDYSINTETEYIIKRIKLYIESQSKRGIICENTNQLAICNRIIELLKIEFLWKPISKKEIVDLGMYT